MNNPKKSSNLFDIYLNLPPQDQQILEFLSLVYEPTTENKIAECIMPLSSQHEFGKLTLKELRAILNALKEKRLIDRDCECHPQIIERISSAASQQPYFSDMIDTVFESDSPSADWDTSHRKRLRDIRIGLYTNNPESTYLFFQEYALFAPDNFAEQHPFYQIAGDMSLDVWLDGILPVSRVFVLEQIITRSINNFEPCTIELDSLFKTIPMITGDITKYLFELAATVLILRGESGKVQRLFKHIPSNVNLSIVQGWFAFLTGNTDQAIKLYQSELNKHHPQSEQWFEFFSDYKGWFYLLALLKTKKKSNIKLAVKLVDQLSHQGHQDIFIYQILRGFSYVLQNQTSKYQQIISKIPLPQNINSMNLLIICWITIWSDETLLTGYLDLLEELLERALDGGYKWFALQYARIASDIWPEREYYINLAYQISEETGLVSIYDFFPRSSEWENLLNELINISDGDPTEKKAKYRLVWLIRYSDDFIHIQPKQQTITAKGDWSKGRNIALKRLKDEEIPGLSKADSRICSTIERDFSYHGNAEYYFNLPQTLVELIGHPLLFLESSPNTPVEFVRGEPELNVDKTDQFYLLTFSSKGRPKDVSVVKETETRFRVYKPTQKHQKVADLLSNRPLKIPLDAEAMLKQTLEALSSIITIHSSIIGNQQKVDAITGISDTIVRLQPFGEGLRIKFRVKPFGIDGNIFKPGFGGQTIMTEIDGRRVQVIRNLDQEDQNAANVISQCPVLEAWKTDLWEYTTEEIEVCLQALVELGDIKNTIRMEWPEGEKFSVSHRGNLKSFSLNINQKQDWFEINGQLRLDESLVLDMKTLLELTADSSGRFLPLGDGEYLALTNEFRKRLESIAALTDETKTGRRFHISRSHALKSLVDNIEDVSGSDVWQQQLTRITKIENEAINLPSTLQADLRDYQYDGFQWLSRLSKLGFGGCLADDMGLGKTLQSLAIIVKQANKGPSLVIAPVSVSLNWQEEAVRFAPALKPILFQGPRRREKIDRPETFDLIICSYAVLHQDIDFLSEIEWQVIVLDEAQVIKNKETKRSKAAMQLKGKSRFITTGTPIENHLGELWNLMNFLNPGLLGNYKSFNTTYVVPIEKNKDTGARNHLKQLIHPFILRRTKNQVLEELPPKTEITLHVEMSDKEFAFYEALRRQSVEKLKDSDSFSGSQHIRILAELTRLRRACCHPSLVQLDIKLPGAKLEIFINIVRELRENNHKALVFSQFVGHLAILRKVLDELCIPYQYLDGSTPLTKRRQSIKAFQSGKGDLFLISLKAGGFGLNLTVADYVIHMDPWWNPAVEDQASDRAHRIGQIRPVTVYRLVTRNTIEEKIIELHKHKRDLADSLLAGTDIAAKLTSTELMAMIQEHDQ